MAEIDLQTRLLRAVVDTFLSTGKGLTRRQIIVQFLDPSIPELLAKLTQNGLLRQDTGKTDAEYNPAIAAFPLSGNEEAVNQAKRGFVIVGEILRKHYFDASERLALPMHELIARSRAIDPSATLPLINLGIYMLVETGLTGGHTIVPNSGGDIEGVFSSERLALVQDFEQQWSFELQRRLPKEEARINDSNRVSQPVTTKSKWEKVEPLGSGGQSEVWLVRSPSRQLEIHKSVEDILRYQELHGMATDSAEEARAYAIALKNLSREETEGDLGALKQFKIPPGEEGELAVSRLKREIQVLSQLRPGLLRLLDSSEDDSWIVTEYCHGGSLEKQIATFKGLPLEALRAFRPLVHAVSLLHTDSVIHRDIKPANVFIKNGTLVLGDFGIVFMDGEASRVTMTDEKVGPRDYMPPWAPIDGRQDDVKPDFDVYMLGKLLWSMVSGRLRLQREYHKRPRHDLEKLYPSDQKMVLINKILNHCITEDQSACLRDAGLLLAVVDEVLALMEGGIQPLDSERRCEVCGKGVYRPAGGTHIGNSYASAYSCDFCTHFQLFANGFPDEAAKKIRNG